MDAVKLLMTAAALGVFVGISFLIEMYLAKQIDLVEIGFIFFCIVCLVALVAILFINFAHARDLGQWEAEEADPATVWWYQHLMQPDAPATSCCGEADAYWCDDYYARDGKAFCKITDDRPDEPRKRPHVDIGTEVEIPDYKLKWDKSNPTGHGVVFLSRNRYVYCYVQPGGA